MVYLTGKELSINAHRPTQSKKSPSHNQYANPADLLPPSFGPSLSASPTAGLLPNLAYVSPRLTKAIVKAGFRFNSIYVAVSVSCLQFLPAYDTQYYIICYLMLALRIDPFSHRTSRKYDKTESRDQKLRRKDVVQRLVNILANLSNGLL